MIFFLLSLDRNLLRRPSWLQMRYPPALTFHMLGIMYGPPQPAMTSLFLDIRL